ncbi:hypothetical protein E2C01_001481 [Portunus trituberculatus]|uniref:Uncharacterized protein n=1 Tax=Portunus trituberculatus TaxID=210409 RepID=A0A5B7CHA5_PORTR|nr:hypothetical protein [Portunus trituberculatus]
MIEGQPAADDVMNTLLPWPWRGVECSGGSRHYEHRDMNGHHEDDLKRQRTQYNTDPLYTNWLAGGTVLPTPRPIPTAPRPPPRRNIPAPFSPLLYGPVPPLLISSSLMSS